MQNLKVVHWEGPCRVLRYLNAYIICGLYYPSISTSEKEFLSYENKLFVSVDVVWGVCIDSRKSISGYCVFMGECLIS